VNKEPEPYPCPICEVEMEVRPYKKGDGFRYGCKGSDENPHTVQLYIRNGAPEGAAIERGVAGQEVEIAFAAVGVGEKAESLLQRVKRLGRKGDQ
jgi:hypothetical protein